jgi:SAM-dependent methyltransferase
MTENVGFWSGRAARWGELVAQEDSFYARRTRLIAALVDRHARGKRVIDVGCGVGTLCRLLAERGYDVNGTDTADTMIDRARENCAGVLGRITARFRRCQEDRLPFAGPFDVVTAIGVFPYVIDDRQFAARLAALLAPDGCLVATSTNRLSLYTLHEVIGHFGRMRPTAEWLSVLRNLVRTGVWSGGFIGDDHGHKCRSAGAFDRALGALGLTAVECCDLYNIRLGKYDFDGAPIARSRAGAMVARRLAWSHIGVFRRSAGGHADG